MLQIQNLAGIYTGEGFLRKGGRRPRLEDSGFRPGPIDVTCDSTTGRIVDISPTRRATPLARAQYLDGSGLVATAGFVDSHTHALHAGNRTQEHFRRWAGESYQQIAADGGGIQHTAAATALAPDEDLEESLTQRLEVMLHSGSTTVEVKSGYADRTEGEIRLLRIIRRIRNRLLAPRVEATFLGLHGVPKNANESEYCESMITALPLVQQESLASYVDSFPEPGFVLVDTAIRFSRAALTKGLRVKVHAEQLTANGAASQFVELGAISVDHLEKLSENDIRVVSHSQTVATLLPAAAFFLGSDNPRARQLLDSNAKVALASDFNPGTAPRATLQLTILLASAQLNMTAAEILCALTVNGAAAMAFEESHGTLLPTAKADLLLWKISSPTKVTARAGLEELFMSGEKPEHVVVRGRLVVDTR